MTPCYQLHVTAYKYYNDQRRLLSSKNTWPYLAVSKACMPASSMNEALVDSRFRTLCCALANHYQHMFYYCRLYACAVMRKMTSSTIPEIHNMLQCGQWRTEPRPHNNFVKMGHMDNVVQKLLLVDCRQTRKSTHKTRLCNASLHRRKRLEESFF